MHLMYKLNVISFSNFHRTDRFENDKSSMKKSWIIFFYFLTPFLSLAQSVKELRIYPENNFRHLTNNNLLYYSNLNNEKIHLSLSHNNSLGELKQIFASELYFVYTSPKRNSVGLFFNTQHIGPFIGIYKPYIFYTKNIQLQKDLELSLTGGFGFNYTQYGGIGVSISKILLFDGFLQLSGKWKNSSLLLKVNQIFNNEENNHESVIFLYQRFISLKAQQILLKNTSHELSINAEYNFYEAQNNYWASTLRYMNQDKIFVGTGFNQLSQIPFFVGIHFKNQSKRTLGVQVAYIRNIENPEKKIVFDEFELRIFIKN